MDVRGLKRIVPFEKNKLAFLVADLSIVTVILVLGFGLARFLSISNAPFIAESPIDTSLGSLPVYALLSLVRGLLSLILSYIVALIFGTLAARKPTYEKIIIPVMDVLQCLPVVSFMPGFIFALTTLFPNSRWGLEFACILMIFTGQAWNLVFAYYESQCTLSNDLRDVSKIAGLGAARQFTLVDLPNGIRPLVYNGMMSMAGGWFFLTVCEAFPLGSKNFRLPGLGSYMKLAFEEQKTTSFVSGLIVMSLIILGLDFILWRPLIAWAGRFRDEDSGEESSAFLAILEKTNIGPFVIDAFKSIREKFFPDDSHESQSHRFIEFAKTTPFVKLPQKAWVIVAQATSQHTFREIPWAVWFITFGLGAFAFNLLVNLPSLAHTIGQVPEKTWIRLIHSLFLSTGRVVAVVVLSTLWTIPVGVWIGKNPRIAKLLQPFVQDIAAFPAPMIFPLLAMILIQWGWTPNLIAITLMVIGNQWYLFFNVLSGASRIPEDLKLVARTYQLTLWQRWRFLYFPAIFPSLVTGWITAAGGSWNASIVAEYVSFPGGESRAEGIGLELTQASAQGDNVTLAAAVCVLTIAIIVLNRTLWRTLQLSAERLRPS